MPPYGGADQVKRAAKSDSNADSEKPDKSNAETISSRPEAPGGDV
jgi:hypothetical protein